MANSAMTFLRLPVLASSGLAVVASGLLYFKQKCEPHRAISAQDPSLLTRYLVN
jgi:hypothetical protein